MFIKRIDTNIIQQHPLRVGLAARNREDATRPTTQRIAHAPQDTQTRVRRVLKNRMIAQNMQPDELSWVSRLQCDVQLLTGNLDQDIAILNIIA